DAVAAARHDPPGLAVTGVRTSAVCRWTDAVDGRTCHRVRAEVRSSDGGNKGIRRRPAHAGVGNDARVLDRDFHAVRRSAVAAGGENGDLARARLLECRAKLLQRGEAVVERALTRPEALADHVYRTAVE